MTKQQALDILKDKIEAHRALSMGETALEWDAATTGVPEKSLEARGRAIGWLNAEMHKRFMAPDTLEAIETLESYKSELSDTENAMARELGREYRKKKAIPADEVERYSAITAQAERVWEKAREQSDFKMIEPYYGKIFDYQRKLCDWYGYDKHPYDALLDDFDRGTTVEMLDSFFDALRRKITPLLGDIMKSGKKHGEITGSFDIEKQKQLMPWLTDMVGYDRTRGKTGEVEHPFCTAFCHDDVRITTKYHEDNLLSALYSTIHESGHALYDQNIDKELEQYGLDGGASMGMHESQSRLFENMIGRSRAFTGVLLPKLRGLFDYFKDYDEDMLYKAVNITKPSLIRIEADELTYSLHIMIRYELEKALITGDIKVSGLPGLWNDKYEEYLGIRPDNDAKGVLQDVHWSGGAVGYFPSYAVGTAYGAQLMYAMKKSIDVDAAVRREDLTPVASWLKDNVHRYGNMLLPEEILKQATGEDFNPGYYVDYLYDKFTDLYLK